MGKGAISAHVGKEYDIHVRVGAANAGHTVYTENRYKLTASEKAKHVLQQLPCAAYTNPAADLVLGPGALISSEILATEISQNELWRRRHGLDPLSLGIDWRAHVITSDHIRREQDTDLADRIGSTSTIAREGIGVATAARVMREAECCTAREYEESLLAMARNDHSAVYVGDMVEFLHSASQSNILLEGTQGTGLSLTTGFPPYTTSRNTTASGLAADCGFGPGDIDKSIIVMRTFPIRVAGNSGPFYSDSEETTFEAIGVEPERTTVTKLVRRVATFSYEQVTDAVRLNRAPETEIALTFADYICPQLYGQTKLAGMSIAETRRLTEFMANIESASVGVPIRMLGTGPHSVIDNPDWV